MSHLRYNKIKDAWVAIAEERVRRPNNFELSCTEVYDINSPFIYGNESLTPNEIYSLRIDGSKPNTPGWLTRVVPNKYNAFDINKELKSKRDGLYDMMSGFGAHEIIIDTPKFPYSVFDFTQEEMQRVLVTAQKRIKDLTKDTRLAYFQLFKNHGSWAGASLSHAHTQLIALPFIPPEIAKEIEASRSYYQKTSRCLLMDIVLEEQKTKTRVIDESERFIAYCPYAAFYPFEIVICTKEKSEDFTKLDEPYLKEFTEILTKILALLNASLKNVSFNLLFKLVPPPRDGRQFGY
ncbi:MAG: galactose-phosphate uridylyltransferase, partial [Pseudomonadota bacterium]